VTERQTTQAAADEAAAEAAREAERAEAAEPAEAAERAEGAGPRANAESGAGEPLEAAAEPPEGAGPGPTEPPDEPLPAGETAAEPVPPDEAPPAEPGDFRDRYLRSAAELENVRKRARRDVAVAESRGIARLARELLPALDNFERALAAAESMPENADHHLTDGIRLVQSELLGALARVGIEPDSPKGEAFDPHRHEAVAQQPVPGTASGIIVEVFQSGYRHGEALLRPAKVVVAA
jgi:molecular chaperone GrpE